MKGIRMIDKIFMVAFHVGCWVIVLLDVAVFVVKRLAK